MSTIGTFSKQEDGFNGTLHTLAFNVKVKIVPITKNKDQGPDYRVLAGAMEIGAAWKRQSKANKPYLSVKLDDPVVSNNSAEACDRLVAWVPCHLCSRFC